MSSPAEFAVTVEAERNLVRTRFAGEFTIATMRAAAARVETLIAPLKPGFSVLADFSQLTSMDFECVPHLTRIMDLCRAQGIGFIVRILPDKKHDIGINMLAVVHYRGEVKTVTVDTLAEAERMLQ
jgi:anti-anti-sigma regulatory factor